MTPAQLSALYDHRNAEIEAQQSVSAGQSYEQGSLDDLLALKADIS